MKVSSLFLAALAAALLPALCRAQTTPNVAVELLEIDPAGVSVVPLDGVVHGRIRYATDAPVRLFLLPYRDGMPVEGYFNSGSPHYAAGAGETIAWFGFHSPQEIDEIRAVADDGRGNDLADAGIPRPLRWQAGAAAVPEAAWVARLKAAPKQVAAEAPNGSDAGGAVLVTVMQLVFLLVPASVVLQFFALRRLDGNLKQLAKASAYAMGALWLFVIVTALAGSNLSPIWLVFLSPLFVLFLGSLLFLHSRRGADDDSLYAGSPR